jgi:ABC-type transport system substrate-binding protein
VKNDTVQALVANGLRALLAGLAVIVIVQYSAVERRQIESTKALTELARAQERLAKAIEQGGAPRPVGVGAGTDPAAGGDSAPAPVSFEVVEGRNFLAPIDRAGYDPRLDGGTLRRHLSTDPKGWNPITENAADTGELYEYITEPLARRRLDAPDIWEGRLAESCVISDDFKTYTFRLRRGVLWHTPAPDAAGGLVPDWQKGDHPVTAHDVKFTLDLLLNPQVEAGHARNYYEDCAGAEAPDDHTVIVRWKKKTYVSIDATLSFTPIPKFLYSRDAQGRPFPAESLGASFNTHWYNDRAIGCGAYRFVEWKPGMHVRLVRNPAYFGRPPHVDEMIWPIVRDPDQVLNRLKVRELDAAGLTPTQYRNEVVDAKPDGPFHPSNRRIEYGHYLRFVFYYIGWNLDRPLFADTRVRRALTHAFPKEQILKNIFQGLGEVTGSPFFLKSPATDPDLPPWPYDPAEARRLLAEAGWTDSDGNGVLDRVIDGKRRDFIFSLLTYANSPEMRDLAKVYKEELLKIGILMNPDLQDWAQMQKRMEDKDFDGYTGGWGLVWDEDPYQIWHSSQADVPKGSNRIGFRNAEVDRLIETLRETFDTRERVRLLRRIHAIIHDEQPYTFFYTPKAVPAWHPYVKNVKFFAIRPQTFSVRWHLERP